MSVSCQSRYETDAERCEARRATYRRSAKRRYYEYRAFCRMYDIRPANHLWTAHCAELRLRPEWQQLRAFARQEAFRYWLDNFSRDEILVLGSGLLMVDADDAVAA
ncbi:MAG: hypothetical protein NUW01_17210 [Gemmatimonadaceae bacterium]|nr:hypothetical protein [Gemmatimonadaceae bacterium]